MKNARHSWQESFTTIAMVMALCGAVVASIGALILAGLTMNVTAISIIVAASLIGTIVMLRS